MVACRRVVAARGPYVFSWNIERARRKDMRGHTHGKFWSPAIVQYSKYEYDGQIVGCQFMHRGLGASDLESHVVVLTEETLYGGTAA